MNEDENDVYLMKSQIRKLNLDLDKKNRRFSNEFKMMIHLNN